MKKYIAIILFFVMIPPLCANANMPGFGNVLTRSMAAYGEIYLDSATGATLTVTSAGTYYQKATSSSNGAVFTTKKLNIRMTRKDSAL